MRALNLSIYDIYNRYSLRKKAKIESSAGFNTNSTTCMIYRRGRGNYDHFFENLNFNN